MSDFDNDLLPPGIHETWRTWVLTGVRREPVDRRRLRGANKGLKRMLVEGMPTPAEKPYTWKDFSDAMVRQSVGDAVAELDARDAQLVKLAYFGCMSNGEIAERLGLSVAAVERRLRDAIDTVSRHVARGRSAGRRIAGLVIAFVTTRWGQVIESVTPASVAAAAATIVMVGSPSLGTAGGPVGHPAAPHQVTSAAAPAAGAEPDAADRPAAATMTGPSPSSGDVSAAAVSGVPGVTVTLPATPQLPLPVQTPTVKTPAVKAPAVKLPSSL